MSGIFYTREPGADGQILSGEGVAPGVGLDQLLERDRPPLRAALEIGSAVADILCIAAEDKSVHGDIRPAHVKVDEAGAVSIEGYGIVRRVTRAPEGRPDQLPADIYGLGLVMHASLSSEGLGNLPNDADGHDDAVVERVLGMDFSAVSTKRWLSEVREFLCKILAFDPAERPPALDAANVLASVAGQCPGDDIAVWAQRAHLRLAGGRPPARQVEENLAGPVSLTGYFKKGEGQKESARKAPSTKGESTAMWSREKLAAMFAEEDDDEPVAPRSAAKPAPAKPQGESLAPARPVAQAMPPAPPKAPPAAPPTASPTTAPFQAAETWSPAKLNSSGDRATDVGAPAAAPPPPAKAPAKPQVVQPARSIQAGNASAAPVREPEDAEPKKGPNVMLIVGVVALLAVLVCAGVGLLGGGGYFFMRQPGTAGTTDGIEKPPDATAKTDASAKTDAPAGTPAGEDPAATLAGSSSPAATSPATTSPAPAASSKPPATAPPAASTTKPAATPSTTAATPSTTKPAATTTAPAATTTKPAVTTTTTAPTSTATSTTTYPVKFTAPGREGKVRCGDGQTAEFTGATTLNFSGTVTCLVQIGQGRGAVQVSRSSTVTCSEDSGKVSCSGGS